jgi:hypothetical protein
MARAMSLDGAPWPGARERRGHTTVAGAQRAGRLAVRDDGSLLVFLSPDQTGALETVRSRAFLASGAPAGPDAPLSAWAGGTHSRPAVVAAGAGYVAAWTAEDQDGSGDGVFARALDAKGAPLGPAFGLAAQTKGAQSDVALAAGADGGFLALWSHQSSGGTGTDVVARRFDEKGVALGPEAPVPATLAGNQGRAAATGQPGGTFVAAWHTPDQDGAALGIYVRRLSATGAPLTGEQQANDFWAGIQRNPAVAAADDKGVLVCWESFGRDTPASYGVGCRLLDAKTLTPLADEFAPHPASGGHQVDVAIAARLGAYAVAWATGDATGVQLQRYDAAAKAFGYRERAPRIARDAFGQPFAAMGPKALWIGWRWLTVSSGEGENLSLRRLDMGE